MQVNMDTLKTTAFVLKNRLKGYKLLQNPKGTSPNEVTMLKTWFGLPQGGLWGECVDKCYHYHRIHRYQKGNKFVQDKTFLLTEYFMDPETKAYPSKRKNYIGYMVKNGIYKPLDKEFVTQEEADKRAIPDWQLDDFDLPQERYEFEEELFLQNKKRGYYRPRPNIFDGIFAIMDWESFRNKVGLPPRKPVKPSFWHVLKTNLKGGGVV